MVAGTATPRRVYRCAICGVGLRDQRWIYSPTTGSRYCPLDAWAECEARSLTTKKAAK